MEHESDDMNLWRVVGTLYRHSSRRWPQLLSSVLGLRKDMRIFLVLITHQIYYRNKFVQIDNLYLYSIHWFILIKVSLETEFFEKPVVLVYCCIQIIILFSVPWHMLVVFKHYIIPTLISTMFYNFIIKSVQQFKTSSQNIIWLVAVTIPILFIAQLMNGPLLWPDLVWHCEQRHSFLRCLMVVCTHILAVVVLMPFLVASLLPPTTHVPATHPQPFKHQYPTGSNTWPHHFYIPPFRENNCYAHAWFYQHVFLFLCAKSLLNCCQLFRTHVILSTFTNMA